MGNLVFLGIAYALVWVAIAIYLFWIAQRQRRLEKRLLDLEDPNKPPN